MQYSFRLDEILNLLEVDRVAGGYAGLITGLASLTCARSGDLSFLGNARYGLDVAKSEASVVLLPRDHGTVPRCNQAFVYVENPSLALALLCERIEQMLWPRPKPGIDVSAQVSPSSAIDPSAYVGPLCVIEAGVTVGPGSIIEALSFLGKGAVIEGDCRLKPGVRVASYCVLGNRVILHSGVVVGSDGFGFETVDGEHCKVPQIGRVRIEDDVEIGANTTIDRARFDETRIGRGTKIDNLVQIAHNVDIGRHCFVAAQSGISGSCVLEDYVVLAGQAGLAGHLTLGKGTVVGAQAGISKSQPPGSYITGTPAFPVALARRIDALQRRLPDLFKRVANLEQCQDLDAKA